MNALSGNSFIRITSFAAIKYQIDSDLIVGNCPMPGGASFPFYQRRWLRHQIDFATVE